MNASNCGKQAMGIDGSSVMATCDLPAGHIGDHQDALRGTIWTNKNELESPLPGPNDAMELGRINNQVVSMRRWGTLQPGGGMLNVYEFDPADFGVIGGAVITGLRDTTKKVRRTAVADVLRLVRTLKLVTGKEEVVSVSVGADSLGNMTLVIVTKIGGAPR